MTLMLGQESSTLTLCTRETTPPEETRLAINTPNKASRRTLLMALKKHKNIVRTSLHLTARERANKALIYRALHRTPVHITDRGDQIDVRRAGPQPQQAITLEIAETPEDLEMKIDGF